MALEIQDEVVLCSQGLDLKNNPLKMDADNNDDLLYVQYLERQFIFHIKLI